MALQNLLEKITAQLKRDGMGIRQAVFTGFKTGHEPVQIEVGTQLAVQDPRRVFRLFEIKLEALSVEPGIDSFLLDIPRTDPVKEKQEKIWQGSAERNSEELAELIDRISNKFGAHRISRFLPDEHHWPERAYQKTNPLFGVEQVQWPSMDRPVVLLSVPEEIQVSVPVPDYPPLLFRHKGQVYEIIQADGPERIEQEWWLQEGLARDYYIVEDKNGQRYWLFRSGYYASGSKPSWFLHGYFG